jgi:hypothetical protein
MGRRNAARSRPREDGAARAISTLPSSQKLVSVVFLVLSQQARNGRGVVLRVFVGFYSRMKIHFAPKKFIRL